MRTKLLLLFATFAVTHSATPPQNIQLSANIKSDSLLIKLQNNEAIPLTVVTGIIADRAYPAANFQFTVRL